MRQRSLLEQKQYDILVVLDACRGDVLKDMRPETEVVTGVAPHTNIWIRKTGQLWVDADMTYLTAQPQVNAMAERYGHDLDLVNVWQRHYGYWTDEKIGAVHPISMASATIEWYNEHESPCVAHFTQPHGPMVGRPPLCARQQHEGTDEANAVRERYASGDLTAERYREAYEGNLKLAMQAVDMLCRNVDATVVVTGDHGESLGEGGRIWHDSSATRDEEPELYRVPWLHIEAESRLPQQIQDRLRTQGHKGVDNA